MVGRQRVAVLFPVAVMTKNEVVSGAKNRGGGIVTDVAETRTGVLGEELVGGVDFPVAGETELCRVGSAVQYRHGISTEVAEPLLGRRHLPPFFFPVTRIVFRRTTHALCFLRKGNRGRSWLAGC